MAQNIQIEACAVIDAHIGNILFMICQNVRTVPNLRHRRGFRTSEVRKDHQKHTWNKAFTSLHLLTRKKPAV